MKPNDCYKILGIRPGAPIAEVRRAYKKLAWKHHPDLAIDSSDATDQFSQITAAYTMLRSIAPRRAMHGDSLKSCPTCGQVQKLYSCLDGSMRCADCLLSQRRKRLPGPPVSTARCLVTIAVLIVAAGCTAFSVRSGNNTTAIAGLCLLVIALALLTRDVLRSIIVN